MSSSKIAPRRNLSVSELKEALAKHLMLRIRGWEILGDVMVMDLGEGYTWEEKRLIGEKILELHPKAATVVNRLSIEDEFRKPVVEVLAGAMTETVYAENGCRFKIDPTKIMFSFGNKEERRRMGLISSPVETVVDMFACVGQFTIPIAKYSKPEKVIAVEKNPIAFEYLVENIRLNKLCNVEPVLGDSREMCPEGVADRVVMGYLFEPHRFLKTAVNALKDKGVIHFHLVSQASQLAEECKRVVMMVEENKASALVLKTVRVKSYAPKRYHWVLDLYVTKRV